MRFCDFDRIRCRWVVVGNHGFLEHARQTSAGTAGSVAAPRGSEHLWPGPALRVPVVAENDCRHESWFGAPMPWNACRGDREIARNLDDAAVGTEDVTRATSALDQNASEVA